MKAITELKKDIEFNKSLKSLVEVLKSIAVSHYHMLERKIKSEEKFFTVLRDFFAFPQLKASRHPFLSSSSRPTGIVAITSDMGLLGGLNMKVMAAALDEASKGPSRLVIIGEKGHGLAKDRGFSFVAFPGVKDEERFGQAMAIRDFLLEEILTGKMGSLVVFYPEPVSFLVQRVKRYAILPFDIPEALETVDLSKGAIFESRLDDVIEYLVGLWMGQSFYEILGFSRLSELSARFIHLEGSSQKLQEVQKKLQLTYFRVRHELIDRSMREIFAARSMYVSASA